eukprot:8097641-Alexandrium_andersonii.AAC.1
MLALPTEDATEGFQGLLGEDLPTADRDLAVDVNLSKPLADLSEAPGRAKRVQATTGSDVA